MLRCRLLSFALVAVGCWATPRLRTVQTAFHPQEPDLLKEMAEVVMESGAVPKTAVLVVNRSIKFQEMLGFGGAFTEAAAINWRALSAEDQAQIMHLYFADPSQGGHGYTVGRVPMGSCDFSVKSYSFDNVAGDVDLSHFDSNVTHDEQVGMLPMIRAAQDLVRGRGKDLKVFASPWSPPPWMKLPDSNGNQSFDGSATPVGLDPKYKRTWAKYFSAFIDAYRSKGVDLWGVTPQNEPEFAAAWDACVYTPEAEAEFVREHLGPVLHKEQPGVKIIGFDHNKDHMVDWAKVLFADNSTKQWFDGIGVHWYGGLNTQHLQATHDIAPDKFILATEACNCGGVVFQENATEWWSRAEKLAIDILEDIKWWATGWVDWNLLLDLSGGPNHAGNLCDANIISDPNKTRGGNTFIMQASYYFMGHFSRFIPPGSRRVGLENSVAAKGKPTAADVQSKMLQFIPCGDNLAEIWHYDADKKTLGVQGVPELCAEVDSKDNESIAMKPCVTGSPSQSWSINNGTFVNGQTQSCLTALLVHGAQIGLDPGVDAEAGFAENCSAAPSPGGDPRNRRYQHFASSGQSLDSFQIKTPEGNCMMPVGMDSVVFDAVAFETPAGDLTLVAMNLGNISLTFNIYDAVAQGGFKAVSLPAHAIASYTWPTSEANRAVEETIFL